MSMSTQPSKSRRYFVLAILAIVCVAGYGLSEGWFGSGSREVEVEGTKTSVSQPTDQEKTALDSSVRETKAETAKE
jgi:hypothetical protein